jgi:hypothetical protein
VTGPWIAAFVALSVVVLLMGIAVLGSLRRLLPILETAQTHRHDPLANQGPGGLPRGQKVPSFQVVHPSGSPVDSIELEGRPTIYLFLSESCHPCHTLLAEIKHADELGMAVDLVALVDDSVETPKLSFPPGINVFYDRDRAAWQAFQANAFPSAFAVDATGRVVDGAICGTLEELRAPARQLREGGEAPVGQVVGVHRH